MKNNENGRSMVEMLGVLAIIGVLSAGGLAGYSKAMFKHKLNTTMDQITMLVTNIRTMYGTQGTYEGLNDLKAYQLGIVPAVMADHSDAVEDDKTTEANEASPESVSLSNPFKGDVHITAVNLTNGDYTVANGGFTVQYTGLPKEACIALATADFGSGAGSGFIGTTISGKTASGSYGSNEGNAYSMSSAITNCSEDVTITWTFY